MEKLMVAETVLSNFGKPLNLRYSLLRDPL